MLFKRINSMLNKELPVQDISDPLEIKRFIGESHLVIGSRFHALASALSQGVPALATSWSHKYEALFEDYGQEHCIVPVDGDIGQVQGLLGNLTGSERTEVVALIREKAQALEQRTRAMWREVDAALGLKAKPSVDSSD